MRSSSEDALNIMKGLRDDSKFVRLVANVGDIGDLEEVSSAKNPPLATVVLSSFLLRRSELPPACTGGSRDSLFPAAEIVRVSFAGITLLLPAFFAHRIF